MKRGKDGIYEVTKKDMKLSHQEQAIDLYKEMDAEKKAQRKQRGSILNIHPIESLKMLTIYIAAFIMGFGIIGMVSPGGYFDFINDIRPMWIVLACAVVPVFMFSIRIVRGSLFMGTVVLCSVIGGYIMFMNFSSSFSPVFAFALGAVMMILLYKF